MAQVKINDRELLRLIDKEKLTQTAVAKQLGVTRQAVSKRLQELRGRTTRVTACKKIEAVVDQGLDTWGQLSKVNKHANWLLDHVMRWIRGDEAAIQVLEKNVRQVNVGTREDPEWATEYKFTDPHQIALRAMAEIRAQIDLQLKIFEMLYSAREVDAFQTEVLEILAEVDKGVRDEIIKRLNAKRVTRQALRFS
jgi:biotin operon repressor